jgi:hypothetical protein
VSGIVCFGLGTYDGAGLTTFGYGGADLDLEAIAIIYETTLVVPTTFTIDLPTQEVAGLFEMVVPITAELYATIQQEINVLKEFIVPLETEHNSIVPQLVEITLATVIEYAKTIGIVKEKEINMVTEDE